MTGEVVTQLWQLGPEIVTTVVAQIEQESGSLGEAMAAVRTLQAAFPIAAPLAVRDPAREDHPPEKSRQAGKPRRVGTGEVHWGKCALSAWCAGTGRRFRG